METTRPESTNQPTSVDQTLGELPIAECQDKLTETLSDDGLTGSSFVAACAVRVGTAHIEVLLPLLNADGSLSDRALRVTERLFTDTLAVLPFVRRLPVKNLSHEDVAVVTRSSLERLVGVVREAVEQFEKYDRHHQAEADKIRKDGAAQGLLGAEIRAIEQRRAKAESNRSFAAYLRSALEPFALVGASDNGAQ